MNNTDNDPQSGNFVSWIIGGTLLLLKVAIGIGVLWLWAKAFIFALDAQWLTAFYYCIAGIGCSIVARMLFPDRI